MAKVKNPQGINNDQSGEIGPVKFVKRNSNKGFTHIIKPKKLKPKKKKIY